MIGTTRLAAALAVAALTAACASPQRPTLLDAEELGVTVVGDATATSPGSGSAADPLGGSADGAATTDRGPGTPTGDTAGSTAPRGSIVSGETAPDDGIVADGAGTGANPADARAAATALDRWLDAVVTADWETVFVSAADGIEVWSRVQQQLVRVSSNRGAIVSTSEHDRALRVSGGSSGRIEFAGSTTLTRHQQVLTESINQDAVIVDPVVTRRSGRWVVTSATINGTPTVFHPGGQVQTFAGHEAVLVGAVDHSRRTTVLVALTGASEPNLFVDDAEMLVSGGKAANTVEGYLITEAPMFIVYSHALSDRRPVIWRAHLSIDGAASVIAFDL